MGMWADEARRTIARVHQSLPDGVDLKDRTQAIDDAYPFGQRSMSPYKTWLKARREYLVHYGYQPKGKTNMESPMERMMRKATP